MGEVERSLGGLAGAINEEHRAFVGAFRKTVEHGIRAGELLAEAKAQCSHGSWLPWLEQNFEGAPRTAQEYMRLYNHRDAIRAKTRDSAHLSVSGALRELAAPARPEGFPDEEWTIVKRATDHPPWSSANLESISALSENERRGFVAEMAWAAMMKQGLLYTEVLPYAEEQMLNVTPELLAELQAAADKLRWWVEQVEWIESIVRACDWPPGAGMPSAAFDEERKHLPLNRLYDAQAGLPSPRERIREFCGAVV